MKSIKTSIQPWLSVKNCIAAESFYKKAFGAIETYRMETADDGLVLKLSVDNSEFWISGQSNYIEEATSENIRQEAIKIILMVEDPDAVFEQAVKEGGKLVFPVSEDFGWRLGRLTDPFGFDWEIGKPLST